MRTVPDLLQQLRSPAWDARVDAIKKLSARSEPSVLEALTSSLYDSDTAVVRAATEALLTRGEEASFEPLLRALNACEPDVDVAEEVQDVLSHRQEPWFVDKCITTLESSPNAEMRAFAAEALGYPLHATRAVDALERAVNDESPAVRSAARESLLRIRGSGTGSSS